jgi:hypothetical protein
MGKLSNSPDRVPRLFMLEAFIKDNAVLSIAGALFAFSSVVQYVESCTKKYVFWNFPLLHGQEINVINIRLVKVKCPFVISA